MVYVNQYYEVNTTTGNATSSYYLGGRLIATLEKNVSENGTLRYVHQDSLSSTSLMTDDAGNQIGDTVKYLPFGETRANPDIPLDKLFTGQRLDGTGLYYYNARYYDPTIGRFISPDTVIPDPTNPQCFNRYSYVQNNPLKYTDPSGHYTVAIGLSLLAGCGPEIDCNIMYVVDDKGNWGIMVCNGGGAIYTPQLSAGTSYQWTSADTIFDLDGISMQFGGSGTVGPGIGFSIGAEYIVGFDDDGISCQGINVNVGIGVGFTGEGHITVSVTEIETGEGPIPYIPIKIPGLPIYFPLELSYDNLMMGLPGLTTVVPKMQQNANNLGITCEDIENMDLSPEDTAYLNLLLLSTSR